MESTEQNRPSFIKACLRAVYGEDYRFMWFILFVSYVFFYFDEEVYTSVEKTVLVLFPSIVYFLAVYTELHPKVVTEGNIEEVSDDSSDYMEADKQSTVGN